MKMQSFFAIAFLTSSLMSNSAIAEDAKNVEWLAVHTSETAEMTSSTTFVMSAAREIFAFSDRPNREYAHLNAYEFEMLWDGSEGGGFKSIPPNAVITWPQGDEMNEAEVIITNTRVISYGREIELSIELLTGSIPSGVELQNVSLFIDDFIGPVVVKYNPACLFNCH
jgi:hypothetical protein